MTPIASRSPRSSSRCCRPCSTRRSWRRRCRRSPPTSGALTDVSWVVTAYVVAAAATTPLWGKLGDRHGRKRLLELALGAVPRRVRRCAGWRSSITDARRRARRAGHRRRRADDARHGGRRRPRRAARARPLPGLHRRDVRGRDGRRAAASAALLVEHASWRWVFYVNLPLGLAALAGLRARLPARRGASEPAPARRRSAPRCSPARPARSCSPASGAATATPGTRPTIVGLFAVALVLGVALVVRERRAADPIVPLDLLRTRDRRASPAPRCSSPPARCSRSPCSCRCSCRSRPARRRPRPGCCSSR